MTKTYCAAPWRGLHINLDGDIRLCCAGEPGSFGNVKTESLECLTQSPYLQEIRTSIQQGNLHPKYCQACIDQIGRGERDWFNETHSDIDFDMIEVDRVHEFQSIDVRWNNTCNLACTYCDPYFSSSWAKLQPRQQRDMPIHRYDTIMDQILQGSDKVRTVMLLGGEPLLIPHNIRLIDALPDQVTVVVITNLSMPLHDNKVFQALARLPNVNWNISMENVHDRFEFVRRGAKWAQLQENVDLLMSLSPQHNVGIAAIYHVFNCTRLRELRRKTDQWNVNTNWNNISQWYLDPSWHATPVRDLARKEIDAMLCDSDISLSPIEHDFFTAMHARLSHQQHHGDARAELYRHLGMDRAAFRSLWPELAGALS